MGNEKGSRETTRNVLSYVEQKKLDEWIVKYYVDLGKDDVGSAAQATQELGFTVSAGNVKSMREVNDIPNNRARAIRVVSDDYAAMEARVAALEYKLTQLTEVVGVLKLAAKHNTK